MRCPNCGTENAPDSRFCGGCGSPFTGPSPQAQGRLAPTGKIADDAPIAPPTRAPHPSLGHPNVSYAPPAMPYAPTPTPEALRAAHIPSIPQTPVTLQRHPNVSGSPSAAPPARTPVASNASMSYAAPASAPLGLIALVLFIDLALAGSGAFLLAKGLSKQTDQTVDQSVEKSGKP